MCLRKRISLEWLRLLLTENKVDNIEEFLEDKVESVGQAPTLKRDVTKSKTRYSHIRNES